VPRRLRYAVAALRLAPDTGAGAAVVRGGAHDSCPCRLRAQWHRWAWAHSLARHLAGDAGPGREKTPKPAGQRLRRATGPDEMDVPIADLATAVLVFYQA